MRETSRWRQLLLLAVLGCLVTITGCYYHDGGHYDDYEDDHHYGGHHH